MTERRPKIEAMKQLVGTQYTYDLDGEHYGVAEFMLFNEAVDRGRKIIEEKQPKSLNISAGKILVYQYIRSGTAQAKFTKPSVS